MYLISAIALLYFNKPLLIWPTPRLHRPIKQTNIVCFSFSVLFFTGLENILLYFIIQICFFASCNLQFQFNILDFFIFFEVKLSRHGEGTVKTFLFWVLIKILLQGVAVQCICQLISAILFSCEVLVLWVAGVMWCQHFLMFRRNHNSLVHMQCESSLSMTFFFTTTSDAVFLFITTTKIST